jgi:hypothetical protein
VLHNSIYMSLHFGKVSSPAQGEFHSLTGGPPPPPPQGPPRPPCTIWSPRSWGPV